MKNVLVISGHTDLQHDSFNNKIIMADLEKALPEARFEYLDAMYPNFKIDVKKEQEQLVGPMLLSFSSPFFGTACRHFWHVGWNRPLNTGFHTAPKERP